MNKTINTFINYFLIGLICLHIILFFIPLKIEAGNLKIAESISDGPNFVISPGGTLVGWGVNDYRLVGNGKQRAADGLAFGGHRAPRGEPRLYRAGLRRGRRRAVSCAGWRG